MLNKLIGVGLTGMLLLAATGCGSKGTNSSSKEGNKGGGNEQVLTIMDWGGVGMDARKKSFYDKFEKEYHAKINVVSPTDYGKIKAMVESGNVEVDIAIADPDFAIRGGNEGLLEKLDYNTITNAKDIYPEFVNDYGVGVDRYSVVIGYNTDTFPTGKQPKSWADFWDVKKFPGKRALWKYPTGLFEVALLADGVQPDKLYPLDVDRAFKSLDKIKKDVSLWWTTGAQPVQALAAGEVPLAMGWNGRVTDAQTKGAPEAVEYNQGVTYGDSWVVLKGTKHKELAMKFINFSIAAENQGAFVNILDYGPMNKKALELVDKGRLEKLGLTSEAASQQIVINTDWWVKNFDQVNDRFEKWLLE